MPVLSGKNQALTAVTHGPFWRIYCPEKADNDAEYLWFRILEDEVARDEEAARFFHLGAAASQTLDHANIFRVLNHGTEAGTHYEVIQPFSGVYFDELLRGRKPVSEDGCLRIYMQLLKALQYAHLRGVTHGALAPSYLFIDNDDRIKIFGFGSGEFIDHLLHDLKSREALRSALFMPPERLREKIVPSGRDDVYAATVLIYRLLTGEMPYKGRSLRAIHRAKGQNIPSPRLINEKISVTTDSLVHRILSPDTTEFPTINEMIRTIDPKQGVPLEIAPAERGTGFSLGGLARRWRLFSPTLVGSKRRTVNILFALVLFFGIILIFLIFATFNTRQRRTTLNLYQEFIAEEVDPAPAGGASTPGGGMQGSAASNASADPGASAASNSFGSREAERERQNSNRSRDAGATAGADPQREPEGVTRRYRFEEVDFADRLTVNGALTSYALPAEVELEPGRHRLAYFDTRSTFSWETEIDLGPDRTEPVVFTAAQIGYGELSVVLANAAQFGYAFVTLDQDPGSRSTTPYRKRLTVGRHRIRIERPGYITQPADTVVVVPLNTRVSVMVRLRPE